MATDTNLGLYSGDGNVDIVYNRAGADETVSLVYTDGAEGLSFDKDIYGLKHEVGMTLDAWNANIDPTDEDVWTFGTLPTNQTAFYQLYDENGANDACYNSNISTNPMLQEMVHTCTQLQQ